ncbi:MAG: hypothetical protein KDB88_03465 [Flavobacteriales bacterium]|nr:hypothetical protein [Flavobacteriales bacterium]
MTIDIRIHTAAAGSEALLDEALQALRTELEAHDSVKLLVNGASFFTMPEPDTQRVVVSIIGWSGTAPAALAAFDQALPIGVSLKALATTVLNGPDADALAEHVLRSGALEVAIRTPKVGQEEHFLRERERFFGVVRQQTGFVFEQELLAVDSDVRAVLIGWKDRPAFMEALGVLGQAPEMGSFFGTIDVHAYQAFERGASTSLRSW